MVLSGRWWLAVVLVSVLMNLSGCAGLRIYDETIDKQGQAAKDAWGKVDTAAVIAAERANLAQLLATEVATQDKVALAIRDHTLHAMVEAPSIDEALIKKVNEQLVKLVGEEGATALKKLRDAESERRVWTTELADSQEVWNQFRLGHPDPSCKDLEDTGKPASKSPKMSIENLVSEQASDSEDVKKTKVLAALTLAQLREICARQPAGPKLNGGYGLTAYKRYADDVDLMIKSKASMLARTNEYKAAVQAYANALPSKDSNASEKTGKALARLKQAIDALERAPDGLSRQFLSKEKLQSLNDFVDTVSKSTESGSLPDEASKATVAFALFPTLFDDAKRSLADAKAPLALPLYIQRNYEQLKLESVTREVAAREAMQRISEAIVNTILDQARQLGTAKNELASVADLAEVKGKSTAEAFKNAPPVARNSLYRGAALYLDALNRLEARRMNLEYQYIAAVHELQLAYAEVNVKQWASLIGATVDQVATAGASGIKGDRVVALLNTLGVFYIGYGVNK